MIIYLLFFYEEVAALIDSETIQGMVGRIVDRFAPQKVLLFGSWARGENTAESDVDLLVIMPFTGSKRDLQVAIRRELKDFSVSKDIVVMSPEELNEKQAINGYIYRPALSEGKVVYE